MGFFTSKKDKVKQPQPQTKLKLKSSSLLEPPNVFVPVKRDTACDYGTQAPPLSTTTAPDGRQQRLRGSGRGSDKDKTRGRHQRHPQYTHHHRNTSAPQLNQPTGPQHQHQGCGPVIVDQHCHLDGQPHQGQDGANNDLQLQRYPYSNSAGFSRSMANMTGGAGALPSYNDGLSAWYGYGTRLVTSTVNACDDISNRLNHVLTLIDGEHLSGHEMDLFSCSQPVALPVKPSQPGQRATNEPSRKNSRERDSARDGAGRQATDVASSVARGNYFTKVELYANSKLPRDLPPFAVYIPIWPLLCLAARYSLSVYERPAGAEREAHVSADWRTGEKAMCIKSVPMDHMHTIVFAIRGTASFMDWAVNLNSAPAQPDGFLDDPGNLCHAGFLSVARRMIRPVAARLRQLLQEDPSRSRHSLMITGHSAGGAIAALLYSHMLAQSSQAESELNLLTGSFKKIHCVTFGTPPVSLLPLTRPDRPELKNSLFLSFVNEGDPVVRADKAYVKTLLELLASPPPETRESSKAKETKHKRGRSAAQRKPRSSKPVWRVPPCTLSNAGRIVALRGGGREDLRRPKDRMTVKERLAEGVVANICREDDLRGLVWGDPVAHLMKLYAGRVEELAVQAVTARKH